MINKIVSIILSIIVGNILYNIFLKKNTIILNYHIKKQDNLEINNKCFTAK